MLVSTLRRLQKNFVRYLTHHDPNIINDIVEQGSIDKETRMNIYQNAYVMRLKETIEQDYENLGFYLGDDLFDEMVNGYINQCPSQYTSLRNYCDNLPGYLEQTEPFKSNPIIAEIAQFESLLIDTFDTEDSDVVTEQELQILSAEHWPRLRLTFHPSVTLFNARWNSVESWQAIKDKKVPPVAKEQNVDWLIWRDPYLITQYCSLGVEGAALYNCFNDNYPFVEACELLLEYFPEEQIAGCVFEYLKKWLKTGVVACYSIN